MRSAGKSGTRRQPEVGCVCPLAWQRCHYAFALAGDRDFDVNIACLQRDKDLLDRARGVFEKNRESAKSERPCVTSSVLRLCAARASFAGKARESAKTRQSKPFVKANAGFAEKSWAKSHGKSKSASKGKGKGKGKNRPQYPAWNSWSSSSW